MPVATRAPHPAGSAVLAGPAGSAGSAVLAGPAGLGPAQLIAVAERLCQVVDPGQPRPDGHGRWWRHLGQATEWEAWLEGWPAGDRIELHDHGGSATAIRVVAGRLLETAVGTGGRLTRRRLEAGSTTWLPPSHVHDLVNVDAVPALSVHVYSPPLRTMTYYTQASGASPVPVRQEIVHAIAR